MLREIREFAALKSSVPFGGEDQHYDSKDEAREAYEKYYYGSSSPTSRKSSYLKSVKASEIEASKKGVWTNIDEPISSVSRLDPAEASALSSSLYQMEDFYNLSRDTKREFILAPNHAQELTDLRDSFNDGGSRDLLVLNS
jgi:hypothetical protein